MKRSERERRECERCECEGMTLGEFRKRWGSSEEPRAFVESECNALTGRLNFRKLPDSFWRALIMLYLKALSCRDDANLGKIIPDFQTMKLHAAEFFFGKEVAKQIQSKERTPTSKRKSPAKGRRSR